MKYVLMLISFSLLIGYYFLNEKEVIGHWHLKNKKLNKTYLTLDVINDSLAYLGLNSIISKTEGTHIKDKKILLFPGSCGSGHFFYKVRNDKIYLKGIHGLGDYEGERCNEGCCDKLKDAIKDIKFRIDLPIVSAKNYNAIVFKDLENDDYETIFFADLKAEHDVFYERKERIGIDGSVADIKDIQYWLELKRNPYLGRKRVIAKIRLIIDKYVNFNEIKGLSTEIKQRLLEVRPDTLAQASRVSGVTPAALSLLAVHMKRELS